MSSEFRVRSQKIRGFKISELRTKLLRTGLSRANGQTPHLLHYVFPNLDFLHLGHGSPCQPVVGRNPRRSRESHEMGEVEDLPEERLERILGKTRLVYQNSHHRGNLSSKTLRTIVLPLVSPYAVSIWLCGYLRGGYDQRFYHGLSGGIWRFFCP